MQELYVYQELTVMHMLAGDTSPTILIDVEGDIDSEAQMRLIVSRVKAPDTAVIIKACNRSDNTFSVNIDSSESKNMRGSYFMDFTLKSGDTTYKRARWLLDVKASPMGV